ncbi:flavodoxin family protein [Acidovorax sp. NPDC077693]|uniref:flavodoxin family protein n=1 Tax=unclassified Acidovorax TaxID=2684926 RepID=UPI0037C9E5A3
MTTSKKIAVVFHSAHGHTEHIAQHVAHGARNVGGTQVQLIEAANLTPAPDVLQEFDGLVWGSPTYLGGVSGVFKTFMDATGGLWRRQQLQGRLAAGFTVSSLPAGDKQSTLQSMFVFSMQHGMVWVGNPILPEQHSGTPYDEAANRLGSWSGLMAQAGHASAPDAFAPGDIRTAHLFGQNFARKVHGFAPHTVQGMVADAAEAAA